MSELYDGINGQRDRVERLEVTKGEAKDGTEPRLLHNGTLLPVRAAGGIGPSKVGQPASFKHIDDLR